MSQNDPKTTSLMTSLTKNPQPPSKCFFRAYKTRVNTFNMLSRFLQNLLESENFIYSATATKKSHCIFQHGSNYLTLSFCKAQGEWRVTWLFLITAYILGKKLV